MVKTQLPPIAQNPAHAHVVATCQQLRQDEIENFFTRLTGSYGASLFLREVLYWFMPSGKQPHVPRTTVRRDERYWFCRSREEWAAKHSFTRYKLETIYRKCADFLDVDHFMFAAQRRTHYSIRFDKLRELIEADEILQNKLRSDVETNPRAVGSENPRPVGGCDPLPSVDSLRSVPPSIPNTERGPVVEPSVAPTAQTAPRLEAVEQQVEERENPPELSNQKVQVILKATEGKPLEEKSRAVRALSPHAKKVVGYLILWQSVFETNHPGRKHFFTDQHLSYARELADQGVPLKDFQVALLAAWEVQGSVEGHDPLFMCRNHSRKFTLFCKHFTRIEEELAGQGLL